MIGKLIIALLKIISKIIGILLLPIDSLLLALIPDLSTYISNIVYYINLPAQYMGWIFELFHVPAAVPVLIVSYWIFKYAVIGAASGVKLVITLYQRFKL